MLTAVGGKRSGLHPSDSRMKSEGRIAGKCFGLLAAAGGKRSAHPCPCPPAHPCSEDPCQDHLGPACASRHLFRSAALSWSEVYQKNADRFSRLQFRGLSPHRQSCPETRALPREDTVKHRTTQQANQLLSPRKNGIAPPPPHPPSPQLRGGNVRICTISVAISTKIYTDQFRVPHDPSHVGHWA